MASANYKRLHLPNSLTKHEEITMIFPRTFSRLDSSRFILTTFLTALLIVLPVAVLAQEKKHPARPATQKPMPEDAARQQPSPVPLKRDEPNKPEGAASEDESRPRDPMSTPTFSGLRFRSRLSQIILLAFTLPRHRAVSGRRSMTERPGHPSLIGKARIQSAP